MNETPLVSVVVLNWNGYPFLERCLGSVMGQTYRPLELIVVDNASTDHFLDLIRQAFPQVRLILNERNLGFAGGNNVGIRASRGKYSMVLNNDAHLKEDGIEKLTGAIEKDEKYGACASKVVLDSKNEVIDSAGTVIGMDGLSIGRGRLDREEGRSQEIRGSGYKEIRRSVK
jgi:GT2 family glycosyltransferase